MPQTYAIILAGGSGTRFWPASRRALPKQLLALTPGSDESLIAATVDRVAPLCGGRNVVVATGAHLVEQTRALLPGVPAEAILGEPVARNTAPCIGWVTQWLMRRDPDAVIMVLPSDHHIADEDAFRATLSRALDSAAQGIVTTVGVRPSRPETGFGYIELGDTVREGVYEVARFVEKPDRPKAEDYVRSGRYLWNAGMFFFRADVMLEAMQRHMPQVWEGLQRIDEAAGSEREGEVIAEVFAQWPSVSIDYGVMEKMDRLHVVPGDFGWSDLGSWEAAWELADKDADGNAVDAGVVVVDGHRNLVRNLSTKGKRVIALVGTDDLCVVETDDALLVMPRERAQDVRAVVDLLKARGEDDLV